MVRLRRANTGDWARLWCWRNDLQTRESSHQSGELTLPDHLVWLDRTLARADCALYVAYDDAQCVGTCRLDKSENEPDTAAVCSITVEPRLRGRGYAEPIISAMRRTAALEWPNYRLVAVVKIANSASLRAFAACGFFLTGIEDGKVTLEA